MVLCSGLGDLQHAIPSPAASQPLIPGEMFARLDNNSGRQLAGVDSGGELVQQDAGFGGVQGREVLEGHSRMANTALLAKTSQRGMDFGLLFVVLVWVLKDLGLGFGCWVWGAEVVKWRLQEDGGEGECCAPVAHTARKLCA